MPEPSPAESTLKRLLEAERQAQQILDRAQTTARETLREVREQASLKTEAARDQAAHRRANRLNEARIQASADAKHALGAAQAQASAFEQRANQHLAEAVELVFQFVTTGGPSAGGGSGRE